MLYISMTYFTYGEEYTGFLWNHYLDCRQSDDATHTCRGRRGV